MGMSPWSEQVERRVNINNVSANSILIIEGSVHLTDQ